MGTFQILGVAALGTWDWIVIGGYFAILFGIAWWVILKSKDTADDYFLAGRNLGWFIVGASIFASNIGSEHLVGLAGSGATDGVAMAHYELHAWCLLVLGWIMVPFFMRSQVFTMPEFLERRFTPTARWVLSIISLVAYVLTKIAVGIFAGGIVFSVLLPELHFMGLDSFWIGSFLVIVLTGIYTVLGGLRAVVYTDTVQTIILVFGSILVTIFGLKALGGWGELREICGSDMFNLWKPLVPANVEGTWAPVRESGRMAWYFNDNLVLQRQLSMAGYAFLRADYRVVVLVYRPVHRPARTRRTERTRGSARLHLGILFKAAARIHLYHPGNDMFRSCKTLCRQ
jgi:SSS family solute:Na+ symporter